MNEAEAQRAAYDRRNKITALERELETGRQLQTDLELWLSTRGRRVRVADRDDAQHLLRRIQSDNTALAHDLERAQA